MYYQQQPYNPYAGILGAIGTIMGMNAARRNEAGIAKTLAGIGEQPAQQPQPQPGQMPIAEPTIAPTPIQSQNVAQRMGLVQGLLPQHPPSTPTLDAPTMQPRMTPVQDKMTQPQGLEAPQVIPEQATAPVAAAPATPAAPAAPVSIDMTNKYNTQLTPQEEIAYQQWKTKTGMGERDYDLRGAFKAGIQPDNRGHLPDTYKKPNAPTFSDESIYHGVDGNLGGKWTKDAQGKWSFSAAPGNFKYQTPEQLQEYWKRAEPDATLNMPNSSAAPKPATMQAPNKTDIQKTYQQQAKAAIQELTSKRGMSYKEALAATQDIVNRKTEEYFNTRANEYADALNLKLDDVIGLDFSSNANKSKALGVISQINRGLQRIGRPGVDMGLMKELMSVNDLKIDKVDTGDGIQYVGYNSDGSKIVLIGGKIMKQLSPSDLARIAASQARGPGAPAGSLTDSKLFDVYKWASAWQEVPTGKEDINGKPIMTRIQNDPQLAAQIGTQLGFRPGQTAPAQNEDPRIAAARAAGYSDAEIQAFVQGGKLPAAPATAPAQPAQPVTANFMGENVPGAVPGYNYQLPNMPQVIPAPENEQRDAWRNTLRR